MPSKYYTFINEPNINVHYTSHKLYVHYTNHTLYERICHRAKRLTNKGLDSILMARWQICR